MAKKNRKFDRNRKRSKAMARYNGEGRDVINKKRKIAKHLAAHPEDKTVHGSVPEFKEPKHHDHKKDHKPDMMWDVEGYYKKDKGAKTGRIEVPHTMYFTVAYPGVRTEFTHLYTEAKKAFDKLKCFACLYKVEGTSVSILEIKRAEPYLSAKARMSYGNLVK